MKRKGWERGTSSVPSPQRLRKAFFLLQRNIIHVDIALGIPAVNVNSYARLGSSRCERNAQLGIAAAARPGRGTILYADIGIRPVQVARKCVGVIRLNRDGLIAFSGSRTARRHLECI